MKRMILLLALAAGIACTAHAQSEITLLAPGPMRTPLDKIVANFQAKTNHKVKVTYGGGPVRRGLASGQLDIGMLYLSDMLPNKDITIVGVLPKEICTPTAIVGFISAKASDPPGARALLDYLASPEAQAIFKDAGFQPQG